MNTVAEVVLTIGVLAAIGCLVLPCLLEVGKYLAEEAHEAIARRRNMQLARTRAELDRKQAELRRTILEIAVGLTRDREQASQQMKAETTRAADRPSTARRSPTHP